MQIKSVQNSNADEKISSLFRHLLEHASKNISPNGDDGHDMVLVVRPIIMDQSLCGGGVVSNSLKIWKTKLRMHFPIRIELRTV